MYILCVLYGYWYRHFEVKTIAILGKTDIIKLTIWIYSNFAGHFAAAKFKQTASNQKTNNKQGYKSGESGTNRATFRTFQGHIYIREFPARKSPDIPGYPRQSPKTAIFSSKTIGNSRFFARFVRQPYFAAAKQAANNPAKRPANATAKGKAAGQLPPAFPPLLFKHGMAPGSNSPTSSESLS